MVTGLPDTGLNDVALVAQPFVGSAQGQGQFSPVMAAAIAEFNALQVVPDALVRMQLWGIPPQATAPGAAAWRRPLAGSPCWAGPGQSAPRGGGGLRRRGAGGGGRPLPPGAGGGRGGAVLGGGGGAAHGAPGARAPPPAGPPLAAEPVRLRPPLHQGGQLGEWLGGEPGLARGGGMAPQRLHPLLPAPLEPRADGTRGHPECGSDVLVLPALLLQLPSASPPSLAPVELRALRLHGASIPSFYASTQRSVVAVAHDFVGKQQIHCLRSSPRQTA